MESLSLYMPINFHVHTLSPNQSKYADFQGNTHLSLKNDLSKIQMKGQKGHLILCPLLNIFNCTSGTEPVHARIIQKFTSAPKGRTIRRLMKRGGGGAGEVQNQYSRKGKSNEKNSRTPINPKKYSCYGLKKNLQKEFDNNKIFLRLKNSPPPSRNFSNGPSLINPSLK